MRVLEACQRGSLQSSPPPLADAAGLPIHQTRDPASPHKVRRRVRNDPDGATIHYTFVFRLHDHRGYLTAIRINDQLIELLIKFGLSFYFSSTLSLAIVARVSLPHLVEDALALALVSSSRPVELCM